MPITASSETEAGNTPPTVRTAALPRNPQAPAAVRRVIVKEPAAQRLPPGGVPIAANTLDIGEQWDYVFRPELFATPKFGGGSGAVPNAVLQYYVFVPNTIHAQPGQVVTVYNYDQILHHRGSSPPLRTTF